MFTLLLLAHIACAVVSLSIAAGVVVATAKQHTATAESRVKKMWYGTVLTLASGTTLAFVTQTTARSSCFSLLSFLLVILAAHSYQKMHAAHQTQ